MWKIDLHATLSRSRGHQSGSDDSGEALNLRFYLDVKDWFCATPIQIQSTPVRTRWFRWGLFLNLRLCTMWKIDLRATPIQIQRTPVQTRWFRWGLFLNRRGCTGIDVKDWFTRYPIQIPRTPVQTRWFRWGLFWESEVVYRCERLICARPYPDPKDKSPDQMIQVRHFWESEVV
jgi:hypothetical protein